MASLDLSPSSPLCYLYVLLLSSLRISFPVDEACTSCSLFLTFTACASFLLLPQVECWPRGGRVRSCVFLGRGARVMMLDGGTVSVLRASCDSTEGRKSMKEGRGSYSGDSSPRNLLSLSTDLPLYPRDWCCDHPSPEQRAHARRVRKATKRPRRA